MSQVYQVAVEPRLAVEFDKAFEFLQSLIDLWLVRKKMSHSLIEEFSDTASKEDSTHECGALGH